MNLKNNTLALIILISTLSFSCKKFVDIRNDTERSPVQTTGDCQQLLDNYDVMNVGYPSDGEASADDYYLSDASYTQTSLDAADRSIYVWAARAIRPNSQPQWQSPYNTVYNANLVLDAVENLRGTTTQTILDGLKGQALFFRAYAFWQIAQLYAKPYLATTAGQDQGIPLFLSSNISGRYDRGTVQQTYNRIIQDLNDAAGLLPTTITIASRPNKTAAYAMLARVYLSMEDYTQALNNASLALAIKSTLLTYTTAMTTSNTPFARFNNEVIFHSVMTPGATLMPGTPTSNIAKIDLALVNSYATNDFRRQIFFKANTGIDAGTFRFTGNYEPSINSNFFNGLAVDEIYLIRAECYARAGNPTSAMADLNTLLRTRWSGTYTNMTATSADDALAKILIERRKELVMRGLRWTDLRRLNRDTRFVKTLTRTVSGTTYTLPPNDLRYTLLIPDEVVVKSNSAIQQNPR